MFNTTMLKRKVLTSILVAGVAAALGCSLALFGASPIEGDTTGTPGTDLTGTPGATATPSVAVIGVIDEIEDDHVIVAGQIYVLPASAIASLEVGDKLIILIRYDCDARVVCGDGEHEEDDG